MPSIDAKDVPDILSRLKTVWKKLDANILTRDADEIRIRIGYSLCPGDGEQMESLIHVAGARKENLWTEASSLKEPRKSSNLLVFKRK
jgi:hypothetical protein